MRKERVSSSSAERAVAWPQAISLSNVALVPHHCRVEMEGGMWGGGHTRSDVALPSRRRNDSAVVVYKNKATNESL